MVAIKSCGLDAWSVAELLREYADLLTKLRDENVGRRKSAEEVERVTGRPCTPGVIRGALRQLDGDIAEKVDQAVDPGVDLDPIRRFATPRQLEALDAYLRLGSIAEAAAALDMSPSGLRRLMSEARTRAAKRGWSPGHDMTETVPAGFSVKGVSTYYDNDLRCGWCHGAGSISDPARLDAARLAAGTGAADRIEVFSLFSCTCPWFRGMVSLPFGAAGGGTPGKETEPMTDYAYAAATSILATDCAICSRPLLDAASVECGVGPVCRKKYLIELTELDDDTRKLANRLVWLCATTTDPDELMGHIASLSLLDCDKLATKLAARCGSVSMTQASDGWLTIKSGYSAEFVADSRGLPGRRWIDKETGTRFAARAWVALQELLLACYRGLLRFEGIDGVARFYRLTELAGVPVATAPTKPPLVPEVSPVAVTAAIEVADLTEGFPFDPTDSTTRAHAAAVLRAQLSKAGFERVTDAELLPYRCGEEVWERPVVSPYPNKPEVGHVVRVFTTITGGEVRAAAKDSIKVVGGRRYWSSRSGSWQLAFFAVAKEKRVNRTGTVEGIANRTLSRCNDAVTACLKDHQGHVSK